MPGNKIDCTFWKYKLYLTYIVIVYHLTCLVASEWYYTNNVTSPWIWVKLDQQIVLIFNTADVLVTQ